MSSHNFVNLSSSSIAGRRLGGDGGRSDVDGRNDVVSSVGRACRGDRHTYQTSERQLDSRHAQVNPQHVIWRQRSACAALVDSAWTEERWCVQARTHPNQHV